jgi:hypothetical protein
MAVNLSYNNTWKEEFNVFSIKNLVVCIPLSNAVNDDV